MKAQEKIAKLLAHGKLDDATASRMLSAIGATKAVIRPVMLNLTDAARYCGWSEWKFRERLRNGAFPVVQFPGDTARWFRVVDLDAAINKNVVQLTPAPVKAA